VDNKAYEGDKRLVIGNIRDSQRNLPPLNDIRLNNLAQQFNNPGGTVSKNWHVDTLAGSFRRPANIVNLGNSPYTLKNTRLSGNIILYADTLLTIDSTAILNNVLVFAKAIVVKSGFHGSCQLFASDSISIEKNCRLEYPSCLGLLRYKSPTIGFPPQVNIGQNAQINGVIFTYEKEASALPATISLDKGALVNGQVYAQHILSTKDNAAVKGSVFTTRFMYQTAFSRYENYLINLKIDAPALSAYYLTSDLTPVASSEKKILQWLEAK
jgi:hypothetical protein